MPSHDVRVADGKEYVLNRKLVNKLSEVRKHRFLLAIGLYLLNTPWMCCKEGNVIIRVSKK